jgi:hypothetical protein
MATKRKYESNTTEIVPVKKVSNEGADPEQCAVCGEIFPKNEMHRTPKGLMCEADWTKGVDDGTI